MIIQLQTQSGEKVAEVELLPFRTFPQVVAWGERFFVLWEARIDTPSIYRECFFAVVPPQQVEQE